MTDPDEVIGRERMILHARGYDPNDPDSRWLGIYRESKRNREWFKAGLAVYSVLDFCWMLVAFNFGVRWLAGFCELAASPLLVLGFGRLWEERSLRELMNPRTASWAFLSDLFTLAPYAIVACAAWITLPPDRWFDSGLGGWLWAGSALLVGAACSLSFRRSEGAVYDVLRYLSYSKMCHNGVAFTVLAAMIVYTLVPTLLAGVWSGGHHLPAVMLGLLVLWVAAAVMDGVRANLKDDSKWIGWKLKAENQHPRSNHQGRRIKRDLGRIPTWAEFMDQHPSEVPWWSKLFQTRLLLQLIKPPRTRKD
jgi:hypothetical protein